MKYLKVRQTIKKGPHYSPCLSQRTARFSEIHSIHQGQLQVLICLLKILPMNLKK